MQSYTEYLYQQLKCSALGTLVMRQGHSAKVTSSWAVGKSVTRCVHTLRLGLVKSGWRASARVRPHSPHGPATTMTYLCGVLVRFTSSGKSNRVTARILASWASGPCREKGRYWTSPTQPGLLEIGHVSGMRG